MFKAIHEWLKRHGDTPMPKDKIAWYEESVIMVDSEDDEGYVLDYSEEDTDDELNLLDSYNEIEYISEDRENSQELAIELMEQYE